MMVKLDALIKELEETLKEKARGAVDLEYDLYDFDVKEEECREIYSRSFSDDYVELKECKLIMRHNEYKNLVLELEGLLVEVVNTLWGTEVNIVYKPKYKITVEGMG